MRTYGKLSKLLLASILAGALTLSAASAGYAMDRAAAREVIEEKGDAVVTLEVVLEMKQQYMGQQDEREVKSEEIGLVIAGDGLVVTNLANVDPSQVSSSFQSEDFSFSSSVKSIKYILDDGTEMEATVVLRDPDLDLAFLRPLEQPEEELYSLPLEDRPEAGMLDEVFTIERAGRIARRTIMSNTGEIAGIVDRPRMFYIPSPNLQTQRTGGPVFTESGELLGLRTVYVFPGGRNALGDSDQPFITVILPTEDIAEVAEQAPAEVSEEDIEEAEAPEEDSSEEEETEEE